MTWRKIRNSLNYSTSIFDDSRIFGWKRELFALLDKDHENQVVFGVSWMVT